ncbi:Protein of unknown function [Gryllus bimaculatus]|nr:Protein of unknown function [Gryllus bimaculatus]
MEKRIVNLRVIRIMNFMCKHKLLDVEYEILVDFPLQQASDRSVVGEYGTWVIQRLQEAHE